MDFIDQKKIKVLLVDNDLWVRKILKATIDECIPNAIIFHAEDGKQAIIACQEEKPDIVFIDRNISEMLNKDISIEIRSLCSSDNMPIILVYGEDNNIKPEWNFGKSIDEFVLKPLSLETMKGILEKWVHIKLIGV